MIKSEELTVMRQDVTRQAEADHVECFDITASTLANVYTVEADFNG